MKTIQNRLEQLEKATTPPKGKVFVLHNQDQPGYYLGGNFYPDLQAVEAAHPGQEVVIIRVVYEGVSLGEL